MPTSPLTRSSPPAGRICVETYPVWPRLGGAPRRVGARQAAGHVHAVAGAVQPPLQPFLGALHSPARPRDLPARQPPQRHLAEIGADITAVRGDPGRRVRTRHAARAGRAARRRPLRWCPCARGLTAAPWSATAPRWLQAIETLVARGFRSCSPRAARDPRVRRHSVVAASIANRLTAETRELSDRRPGPAPPQELMSCSRRRRSRCAPGCTWRSSPSTSARPWWPWPMSSRAASCSRALGMPERVIDFDSIYGDALTTAIAATIENPVLPSSVAAMRAEARRSAGPAGWCAELRRSLMQVSPASALRPAELHQSSPAPAPARAERPSDGVPTPAERVR